jgi:drug/metabolite transporter (DMT)-like permease
VKPKDWGQFIVLSLIWGSSFLWIKLLIQEMGPFTLVAWRLALGLVAAGVIVLWKRPPLPRQARLWIGLAFLAVASSALPFFLISWGEQFIDSTVASVLNSTVPLFTVIIAQFFLPEERLTWNRGAGLVMGFIGIVLLMSRDLQTGFVVSDIRGQIAVLLAALSYGVSGVYVRHSLREVPPIVQALVPLALADALTWVAATTFEAPIQAPASAVTWFALVWLGVLGTGIGFWLFFELLSSVGPTRASLVTYAVAVLGVFLGVLVLSEPIDIRLVGGAALVITGIWTVNRKQKKSVAV